MSLRLIEFDLIAGVFEGRSYEQLQKGTHHLSAGTYRFAFLADACTDQGHEPLDAMLAHRRTYVSVSFRQQVIRSIGGLSEDADDGIDGVAVASDSAFDALTSVCVTFDDTDPVVIP